MRFWRITTAKWALDKLCDGTRVNGGRWNPIGFPVLYAGSTIEISALEKFIHLAGVVHPALKLVSVDVPDDPALVFRPQRADFPADWSELPVSTGAQNFGREWIDLASHLVMLVPSAVIPEAMNAVINPAHPEYRNVKLEIVRNFTFDGRMFKG
ncbi:MAG: RES family NAD+ phosphorylase [Oxalobacteraceae bacterium]